MAMTGDQNRDFKVAVHDLTARVAAHYGIDPADYRCELITRYDDEQAATTEQQQRSAEATTAARLPVPVLDLNAADTEAESARYAAAVQAWSGTEPDEPMIGPGVPLSALKDAIARDPRVKAVDPQVGRAVTFLRRLADPRLLEGGPEHTPLRELAARAAYAQLALAALGFPPDHDNDTEEHRED